MPVRDNSKRSWVHATQLFSMVISWQTTVPYDNQNIYLDARKIWIHSSATGNFYNCTHSPLNSHSLSSFLEIIILSLIILFLQEHFIKRNQQYVIIQDSFFSFSLVPWKFVQVVTCINTWLISIDGWYSMIWMYRFYLIFLYEGHLRCFQGFVTANKILWTVKPRILCEHMF